MRERLASFYRGGGSRNQRQKRERVSVVKMVKSEQRSAFLEAESTVMVLKHCKIVAPAPEFNDLRQPHLLACSVPADQPTKVRSSFIIVCPSSNK